MSGSEILRIDAPVGASTDYGRVNALSGDLAVVGDRATGRLYTFDASTGEQIGVIATGLINTGGRPITTITYVEMEGSQLIVGKRTGDQLTASIFDVVTGEKVFDFPTVTNGSEPYTAVSIDGNHAVFVVDNNPILGADSGPVYVATFGEISISGDYNNNGTVEQSDLDLVLLHWGEAASPVPDGWASQLPLGRVDQDELDAVLLNWGNTTPAATATAAVPEPSSALLATLLAVGALAVVRRGR
jgi:hypothetical protein